MKSASFISESNNQIVYIFGGVGNSIFLKDLWSFDLNFLLWELEEAFIRFPPLYAYSYTSFEYNSQFYFCLYSGYDINENLNMDILMYNLFRLNITSLKWTSLISIGDNTYFRYTSGIAYYNNSIYVANFYNSVFLYKYDLDHNQTEYIGKFGSCDHIYSLNNYFFFATSGMNTFLMDLSSNYSIIELQNNFQISPTFTGFNNTVCTFSGYQICNNFSIVNFDDNYMINSSFVIGNYISPHSRVFSSLTQINAFFCLFGGIENYVYFNDLWLYDIPNKLWQLSKPLGTSPSPRASHAAASSGDALLIWGGEGNSGLMNDLFIYNYLINTWIEIIPGSSNIPNARKGSCLTFNMPLAYLFGGETDVDSSGELWKYDFTTNKYTLISVYNIGLAYMSCQLINNTFYSYCGSNKLQTYYMERVWYNFSINSWNSEENSGLCWRYGMSIQLGEVSIYYGGIYSTYKSFSSIYIQSYGFGNYSEENICLFAMGYAYFQSQLYLFSGGASSSLCWFNINIGSETFGVIDIGDILLEYNFTIICSPGTYMSNEECLLCPAGTYAEGYGSVNCTPCGIGKFGPNTASTSKKQCYPCFTGTFNPEIGANRCLECPAGIVCGIGTYTLERNTQNNLHDSIQPLKYSKKNYDKQIMYVQICIGICIASVLIILLIFRCMKIEDFDIFKSHHSYLLRKPIILKKTKFGGAFSILFIFLSLLLMLTAILTYSLENIDELKVLQPLPVLQNEANKFYADIQVIAEFENYGDICESNNACSTEINVIASNFDILHGNYSCQQTKNSCIVSFICLKCVIGSQASVRFILQSAYSYSSSININVTSTSSIPESISSVHTSITAQHSKLFVGSVDSNFYFIMTPSLFISYVPEFDSNITGYHATENMIPVPGTEYPVDELAITSQLGVTVYLTQSESGLYTERYQIQDFLMLFNAILGSIAGLMTFTRLFMQIFERYYERVFTKKKPRNLFLELKSNRKVLSLNLRNKKKSFLKILPSPRSAEQIDPHCSYTTSYLNSLVSDSRVG